VQSSDIVLLGRSFCTFYSDKSEIIIIGMPYGWSKIAELSEGNHNRIHPVNNGTCGYHSGIRPINCLKTISDPKKKYCLSHGAGAKVFLPQRDMDLENRIKENSL